MDKVIVFKIVNGGISVITPSKDIVAEVQARIYSVHQGIKDAEAIRSILTVIAEKDVPTGSPYKIVDATEVPTDRTFRDAWGSDFTIYDGVGV